MSSVLIRRLAKEGPFSRAELLEAWSDIRRRMPDGDHHRLLERANQAAQSNGWSLSRTVTWLCEARKFREQGWPMFARVLLLALFLMSARAQAFPEMVRLGYGNCSSCHVSPSGGGVLTPYGKAASEDALATWSAEGEGSPLFGLIQEPKEISASGHIRYLYTNQSKFLMQAESGGAYSPVPGTTVVGTAGVYGPRREREYRESYAIVQPSKFLSLRGGKFDRSYGLNLPDHTALVKDALGFGQGTQSYNAEVFYRDGNGEVSATQVLGDSGTLNSAGPDGVVYATRAETAEVLRAALYLGDRGEFGFSTMRGSGPVRDRTLANVFLILGFTPSVYAMAEVDGERFDHDHTRILDTSILGWEAVKGLHLTAFHERDWSTVLDRWGAGLDWFPRPHFEAETKVSWLGRSRLGLLMLHYYL